MAMVKRNAASGTLKPIVGYAKVKNMNVGDTITGVLNGTLTTKGQFPKLNYLIELSDSFTFTTYDSKQSQNIEVFGQSGDVIALETFSELSRNLKDSDKGRALQITYTGRAAKAKPGQKKAYLVDVSVEEDISAAPASAPAPKKAASGFPFNKKN